MYLWQKPKIPKVFLEKFKQIKKCNLNNHFQYKNSLPTYPSLGHININLFYTFVIQVI